MSDTPDRAKWQIIATTTCAVLSVVALVTSLASMGISSGPGEVSVILHGGFIALGLGLAGVFLAVAAWFWLWRIKIVRYAGLTVVGAALLLLGVLLTRDYLTKIADQRERDRIQAVQNEIALAYRDRLVAQMPDAEDAIALYRQFSNEPDLRSYAHVPDSEGEIAFRAQWLLYYRTFFNEAQFEDRVAFHPNAEDCAFFLDAFGERYGEIAPVPMFDALCTDRWRRHTTCWTAPNRSAHWPD